MNHSPKTVPRRELVTLLAYIEAGSHKAAAHRLGISESTSRRRVSQLMTRVGANNAAQTTWLLRAELEHIGAARNHDPVGKGRNARPCHSILLAPPTSRIAGVPTDRATPGLWYNLIKLSNAPGMPGPQGRQIRNGVRDGMRNPEMRAFIEAELRKPDLAEQERRAFERLLTMGLEDDE